jgi:hypothetical protein
MITERDRFDCGMSISTAIFKARLWRERLQGEYTDPRNGMAVELLTTLGNDAKTLSDSQWASLKPHFETRPVQWRDAANATTRMVGFKSRVKDLPTFVAAMLENLVARDAVHAA